MPFTSKGAGSIPSTKERPQDEDFHLSATQTVKAPMMHRTGGYRYYDGGTFQALELPYKGNDLSMVVLLPKDPRRPASARAIVDRRRGERLAAEASVRR